MKWRDKKAIVRRSLICIVGVAFCRRFLLWSSKETQEINNSSNTTMKLSLWLMPPLQVATILEERISLYSKMGGGPYFDPHVTVVGGITSDSRANAKKIARLLQEELLGFGEISAVFDPMAQNLDSWNQALVHEMDATPKFVRLCKRIRGSLSMNTKDLFPPPINAPHLSLFYGVDHVPNAEDVEPVPNFNSSTLALWITDPSTVAGVAQWEFLDEISLL